MYLTPRGRGGSRMSRRVKEFVDIADHVRSTSSSTNWPRFAPPSGRFRSRAEASRRRGVRPPDHHLLLARPDGRGGRDARSATPRRSAKPRSASSSGSRPSSASSATPRRASAGSCASSPSRSGGAELQRQPVHAIAKAGRLRPVVEDVAEVPAAARAQDFGALHQQAAVGARDDGIGATAARSSASRCRSRTWSPS